MKHYLAIKNHKTLLHTKTQMNVKNLMLKNWAQWLMPAIPATEEAKAKEDHGLRPTWGES
jgi:hypothetical protein